MNKFLEAFNKQDKTYEAIGRELDLGATSIWSILNGKRGTRYKIAVEIGRILSMGKDDIQAAWLEIVNQMAKQEINRYETATEKPKIYPKKKKNRKEREKTYIRVKK